jgi:hypothetical protein
MKLFPLTVCLFLASSVNQIAQASGCFLVDPSGRKIEMDFCGINNTRQPSAPNRESENFRQPVTPSPKKAEEPIQPERRVTNEQWQEVKALAAQRGEKNPVYYQDIKNIMGFPGELVGANADGSQKYEWRDTKNPEIKVTGVFLDDELRHLSGVVY